MAVEATRDALRGAKPSDTQVLFFATTTPPYGEKLNAATVGAATLMRLSFAPPISQARCAQYVRDAASVRRRQSGCEQAVAAMADCRLAAPEGKAEQSNGDAPPHSSSAMTT